MKPAAVSMAAAGVSKEMAGNNKLKKTAEEIDCSIEA